LFIVVVVIAQLPAHLLSSVVQVEEVSDHSPVLPWIQTSISNWIIIGSDQRPETKQGIEGKIDRCRSGRVRVRVRYN